MCRLASADSYLGILVSPNGGQDSNVGLHFKVSNVASWFLCDPHRWHIFKLSISFRSLQCGIPCGLILQRRLNWFHGRQCVRAIIILMLSNCSLQCNAVCLYSVHVPLLMSCLFNKIRFYLLSMTCSKGRKPVFWS